MPVKLLILQAFISIWILSHKLALETVPNKTIKYRFVRGKNPITWASSYRFDSHKKRTPKDSLDGGPGGSRTHGRQGLGNLRSILLSYRAIVLF